jgi:hypothetical protein
VEIEGGSLRSPIFLKLFLPFYSLYYQRISIIFRKNFEKSLAKDLEDKKKLVLLHPPRQKAWRCKRRVL